MDSGAGAHFVARKKSSRRSKVAWIVCVALLLLACTGAGSYLYLTRDRDPIPPEIRQTATTYPVYYPTRPPKGYTFDRQSISATSKAVFYSLSTRKKERVVITVQPRPKEVKFEDFYNRLLTNKADLYSPEGKAVLGTTEGKTFGSLLTDQTWILVNPTSDLDRKALGQFVESLTRVNPHSK